MTEEESYRHVPTQHLSLLSARSLRTTHVGCQDLNTFSVTHSSSSLASSLHGAWALSRPMVLHSDRRKHSHLTHCTHLRRSLCAVYPTTAHFSHFKYKCGMAQLRRHVSNPASECFQARCSLRPSQPLHSALAPYCGYCFAGHSALASQASISKLSGPASH